MRLGRMGDMERELAAVKVRLAAAEEGRETMSTRCDRLGQRTRELEQAVSHANEERDRANLLATAAEEKLAGRLEQPPAAASAGGGLQPPPGAAGFRPSPDKPGGGSGPVAAAAAAAADSPLSADDVKEYGKFLGMDVEADSHLLWIAKEAMEAPLPEGWTQHEDKDGFVYFYNTGTEQSTYEHPMDDFYRKVYAKARTGGSGGPAVAFGTPGGGGGLAAAAGGSGAGAAQRFEPASRTSVSGGRPFSSSRVSPQGVFPSPAELLNVLETLASTGWPATVAGPAGRHPAIPAERRRRPAALAAAAATSGPIPRAAGTAGGGECAAAFAAAAAAGAAAAAARRRGGCRCSAGDPSWGSWRRW